MDTEARTYGDQLLAEAIAAYRAYDEVSDPDDIDNAEATAAGSVIGALLAYIREEHGIDIHAESKGDDEIVDGAEPLTDDDDECHADGPCYGDCNKEV